jgi:hypothetical protein
MPEPREGPGETQPAPPLGWVAVVKRADGSCDVLSAVSEAFEPAQQARDKWHTSARSRPDLFPSNATYVVGAIHEVNHDQP